MSGTSLVWTNTLGTITSRRGRLRCRGRRQRGCLGASLQYRFAKAITGPRRIPSVMMPTRLTPAPLLASITATISP
jgi:hypothetical protein